MRTLSRYVLKAHLAPAAAGLAIFYFVLSMDFIVDYLNLFIAKGVPGMAVLEGFGLSLAWMTIMAVPMSVMVAVLTAFGRLSGDNEITAAKANGINVFSLMLPVLVAAALIGGGLFWFGNHLLPAANHRLKILLVDIHKVRPLATIEPGILTELPGGYTILVERLDSRTSEIFDVKIHKLEGDRPLQTVVAERGLISSDRDEDFVRLELQNGEIHEIDPDDPTRFNRLLFDRHVINVEETGTRLVRSDRARKGDRELSLEELRERRAEKEQEVLEASENAVAALDARLEAILDRAHGATEPGQPAGLAAARTSSFHQAESNIRTMNSSLRHVRRLDVEYHKKLAIPCACLVFVLVGAPLGIRSRRGGVGMGAGMGILFFLVYYLFLVGGEQLGDRGIVTPFWAMWSANVLFGGLGVFLTISVSREWRMPPVARFIDFVVRAPRRPAVEEAA